MRTIIAICFILAMPSAWAETCKTIDSTGWTQDQKNMIPTTVNGLADSIDINHEKITFKGNYSGQNQFQICVQGAFNLTPFTESALLTRYASDEAARQAATALEVQHLNTLKAEIGSNQACQAKLSTIDSAIDGLSTVAELKSFLKKLARCFVAVRELNE